MERIAFDLVAFHCGVEKPQIEKGVVSHQNGALAATLLDRFADRGENLPQRFSFRQGQTERKMRVDAVKVECFLVDIQPRKRFHMAGMGLSEV